MKLYVTWSAMGLRALWLVNIALGVYVAYFAAANARPWVITHVFTGVLVVALLWFLGIAQAIVKNGSLRLTGVTFVVGLAVALIGMVQVAIPDGIGLYIVQGLHILFVIAAIGAGEVCFHRYRDGIAGQPA